MTNRSWTARSVRFLRLPARISARPTGSAAGLLSTVTESFTSGAMTYGYQGGRLKSTTWSGPVSGSVSLNFFGDGLVQDQSVNGANLAAFGYDKDGLLTSAGSMTLMRTESTGFAQDVSLAGFVPHTLRAPNDFGELTSEITGSHYSVQYLNRDKLGRVTTKIESLQGGPSKTTQYTYDARGRLGQVFEDSLLVRDYRYDDNSNRTSTDGGLTTTASYDNQDRLLSYGPASYTYTANGELLTKLESGQTTSYSYDLLGNLRTVNLPDGRTLTYVIDGANRRIGKRINGTPVQGFLYGDQLEPVAELDGSNSLVSRFVYGSKANVPDYMTKGSETFRILSDELGTVRLVVSTSGMVRQRLDYDEFGNLTSRQEFDAGGVLITPTPAPFQPFGFAGGLVDYDTGLVRFGARDYDPVAGRWTSKDPIRFAGGDTNLFGYAVQDPVNSIDSSGQGLRGVILKQVMKRIGGAIGGRIADELFGADPSPCATYDCNGDGMIDDEDFDGIPDFFDKDPQDPNVPVPTPPGSCQPTRPPGDFSPDPSVFQPPAAGPT